MDIFSRSKKEGKTGQLLAWPGRDKIDPRVSFSFEIHVGLRIAFYEKMGSSIREMPIDAEYQREAWFVGAAYNPWKIVNKFPETIQQRLAHWAVYIRPCSSSENGPVYRVFGMNFLTDTTSDLILEDVWGTPGEGGAGSWKNMICREEFKQVLEPQRGKPLRGIEEKVMYFNLEEFVLHLQWILRVFLRRSPYYPGVDNPNTEYASDKYALLTANCQHFVRFAIRLLEVSEWTDRSRLMEKFSLAFLGQQIKLNIEEREPFNAQAIATRLESLNLERPAWLDRLDANIAAVSPRAARDQAAVDQAVSERTVQGGKARKGRKKMFWLIEDT